MANALYDSGRAAFLSGLDWTTGSFKAALVGAGYTPSPTTDSFLSDIPGGEVIATSDAFSGLDATAGVANANNVTFASVTGADGDYIVIYEDTGVAGTSQLIALIDTAIGLPVTPNGGDIVVAWDTGDNKIFKL